MSSAEAALNNPRAAVPEPTQPSALAIQTAAMAEAYHPHATLVPTPTHDPADIVPPPPAPAPPSQSEMGLGDKLFWIWLTIFGVGLGALTQLWYVGAGLMLIGGVGLFFSIRKHLRLKSSRVWVVIIAMVIATATTSYDIYLHFSRTQSQVAQKNDTLNWNDALYIEDAFMKLPRPCLVKLTSTNPASRNSRNILAKIIREHQACVILDDEADGRQEFRKDVDAVPPGPLVGLLMRWSESYSPATDTFHVLEGNFCPVTEGHAMPEASPKNLIWITVGDGFPWLHTSSCQ